ncbi:DUF6286 domain-containing protein [Streptomyces termitum]|uniref:DUF6286 domain-containing protein n=1 Tax=Streptomyces termitum TaxID=67368 RepID=A0A918T126_9ACTN|nr:DUF6286 domain-containing protein [Streptomyces termitum]GHA81521.1 hypothetical protein GCM10010305_26500 [Streptomyces termitum]
MTTPPPAGTPAAGSGTTAPEAPDAPDAVPVLGGDGGGERVRRFWAVRRVPAALLAAVVLAGAGLLLYDVAAVRAGHTAMEWRRSLARGLATKPLDDPVVLVGASLAALLGLWLLLLAVTPGLRSVLPMRRTHPDVRAGLDRKAAALALRDRAMEVSGVQSVRVKAGRRKVAVRARSHFRPLDEVRTDVETVLAQGVRDLGLAAPPALKIRVDRPPTKG